MPTAIKKKKTAGVNPNNIVEANDKIVKMKYMGHDVEIELYSKFDFTGFDKKTIIDWYKLNHLGRRLDEKAALY